MEILFFGQLTDVTGTSSIQIENPSDLEGLKKVLFEKYPMLRNSAFLVAVDNKLTNENIILMDNSVIAFMSPYSGG